MADVVVISFPTRGDELFLLSRISPDGSARSHAASFEDASGGFEGRARILAARYQIGEQEGAYGYPMLSVTLPNGSEDPTGAIMVRANDADNLLADAIQQAEVAAKKTNGGEPWQRHLSIFLRHMADQALADEAGCQTTDLPPDLSDPVGLFVVPDHLIARLTGSNGELEAATVTDGLSEKVSVVDRKMVFRRSLPSLVLPSQGLRGAVCSRAEGLIADAILEHHERCVVLRKAGLGLVREVKLDETERAKMPVLVIEDLGESFGEGQERYAVALCRLDLCGSPENPELTLTPVCSARIGTVEIPEVISILAEGTSGWATDALASNDLCSIFLRGQGQIDETTAVADLPPRMFAGNVGLNAERGAILRAVYLWGPQSKRGDKADGVDGSSLSWLRAEIAEQRRPTTAELERVDEDLDHAAQDATGSAECRTVAAPTEEQELPGTVPETGPDAEVTDTPQLEVAEKQGETPDEDYAAQNDDVEAEAQDKAEDLTPDHDTSDDIPDVVGGQDDGEGAGDTASSGGYSLPPTVAKPQKMLLTREEMAAQIARLAGKKPSPVAKTATSEPAAADREDAADIPLREILWPVLLDRIGSHGRDILAARFPALETVPRDLLPTILELFWKHAETPKGRESVSRAVTDAKSRADAELSIAKAVAYAATVRAKLGGSKAFRAPSAKTWDRLLGGAWGDEPATQTPAKGADANGR
tara:strand:- start:23496 stop:25610 length:2115 start_codon:yes stop_codon:yes gene_type:complete